ncbi:MAG: hypothetical protein P4L54_06470 [Acidocella sp.]|nr:hypothetical protein [Acidocella sp.]
MPSRRGSDTIVIQTFRQHDIPPWIARCLASVRAWALLHGHDYVLAGDEFFELCGPEYLARGKKNPQAITNLARLVATRQRLDEGYQKVIWLDADTLVFDPERLVLDFPADQLKVGYAFGREMWLRQHSLHELQISPPMPHNAATYFTPAAVDLDMLIDLIRHIDAQRQLVSNFQVGVRLLKGLQYSLMFPTFSHCAMFSPALLGYLAAQNPQALAIYGRAFKFQSCAGNLCLSVKGELPLPLLNRAMDILLTSRGEALNRYAAEPRLDLTPYDEVLDESHG